jgi:hypothetical protein
MRLVLETLDTVCAVAPEGLAALREILEKMPDGLLTAPSAGRKA